MKNELGNTLKQSENPQNVTSDVSRYIVVCTISALSAHWKWIWSRTTPNELSSEWHLSWVAWLTMIVAVRGCFIASKPYRQDMEKNLFFLWNGYRTTYPPLNWLILADKTFPSSCRNYYDICNKMMLAKQQYT